MSLGRLKMSDKKYKNLYFQKTSGIYCYENKINKKRYIGLAINLFDRINRHEKNFLIKNFEKTNCGENKMLWKAVNKYGRKNFSIFILEECEKDKLEERETYYIKNMNSHITENGYNVLWGGFSRLGTKHTKKSRKKMSKNNPRPFLGRKHSDETKKIMSILKKGIPLSEEHKRKLSENSARTFLGKKHTEETKNKMSKAKKGIPLRQEHRDKISKANTGKKKTPEMIKKFSEKRISMAIKEKGSSSSFVGVYFDKNCGKWRTQIRRDGKYINLPVLSLELDAAKAYDKYVIENNLPNPLNFPEDYPERKEMK